MSLFAQVSEKGCRARALITFGCAETAPFVCVGLGVVRSTRLSTSPTTGSQDHGAFATAVAMGCVISSYVARHAFAPGPPTYTADDVAIWLSTDRGNMIPAFHINKGYPLTILVSHTNAEDLGHVYAMWGPLSEKLRVNVFAFEYSGYGHATGLPTERNLYSDARAAIARLVEHGLKPEHEVVLYGKSIGSCAACYIASRHRVRGVILVSPLASGARVISRSPLAKLVDAAAFDNLVHGALTSEPGTPRHLP